MAAMTGHGTAERYRQHILERSEPCAPCREAERVKKASFRARRYLNRGPMRVDATGTRRRVQALAAIGWPARELAERVGCDRTNVTKWTTQKQVHVATAATVRALYDALSMTPGPSDVARRKARECGWPAPLAWDDETIDDPAARPRRTGGRQLKKGQAFDEIAVERAMAGDDVHLTPAERREAALRLSAKGLSLTQVAALLRTAPRSVNRYRTAA